MLKVGKVLKSNRVIVNGEFFPINDVGLGLEKSDKYTESQQIIGRIIRTKEPFNIGIPVTTKNSMVTKRVTEIRGGWVRLNNEGKSVRKSQLERRIVDVFEPLDKDNAMLVINEVLDLARSSKRFNRKEKDIVNIIEIFNKQIVL